MNPRSWFEPVLVGTKLGNKPLFDDSGLSIGDNFFNMLQVETREVQHREDEGLVVKGEDVVVEDEADELKNRNASLAFLVIEFPTILVIEFPTILIMRTKKMTWKPIVPLYVAGGLEQFPINLHHNFFRNKY
eukprot:g37061.t1